LLKGVGHVLSVVEYWRYRGDYPYRAGRHDLVLDSGDQSAHRYWEVIAPQDVVGGRGKCVLINAYRRSVETHSFFFCDKLLKKNKK